MSLLTMIYNFTIYVNRFSSQHKLSSEMSFIFYSVYFFPFIREGHRRRPHEPEVIAMGDKEALGEEV